MNAEQEPDKIDVRMRALCFDGQRVTLENVRRPRPEPHEALVRVRMAGVCTTDLELLRGNDQFRGVMGHQMVGEVVQCPGDRSWQGRRVTVELNEACRACSMCQRALPQHCINRRVMGLHNKAGCFADYVTAPLTNLHAIPDTVKDEEAVFTEPLAAAYAILEQVPIAEDDHVAVVGDGKLGLLIALVLQDHGCILTVVGRHAHKLALASAQGATTVLEDAVGDTSFDVIIEASGSPSGLQLALKHVRARGTVVLKSTYHAKSNDHHPLLNTTRIVVDELTLVGSRWGPFDVALRALAQGRIDPRPLIEARYGLGEGVAAIEQASKQGALKVVLDAS